MSGTVPVPTAATPSGPPDKIPSPSQRDAIEAEPRALLVLAGPGAGKTYCLTERIRFLIEHYGIDPARICAFTFTNKAAGEIAQRLEERLGPVADAITRGTIHAFCADLLRSYGDRIGLDPGFGIADEESQLRVLTRLEGPRPWHGTVLKRFSAHRLRGDALSHDDFVLFSRYEHFLAKRNVLDFDTLIVKAVALLEKHDDTAVMRSRWDVVLVDEFQDLSPAQYRVVKALARDHRHVFAVGDHEQSIYSWAGADPTVFTDFLNNFNISTTKQIGENRRCPHQVFELARRLVAINRPIVAGTLGPRADRQSPFAVEALAFSNDDEEAKWIVDDIGRDRAQCGHRWGDIAILYAKHATGSRLEGALLSSEIPCRLVKGRALADDPVVAYVLAAADIVTHPGDKTQHNAFFRALLPPALYGSALAAADSKRIGLRSQLQWMASHMPRADEDGRAVRRALANWRNLEAVAKQHSTFASLVQDLLSRKVGPTTSVLMEHHDEITDPAALPDVVALAARLREIRAHHQTVCIPPLGGVDIAIQGLLGEIGVKAVRLAKSSGRQVEHLDPDCVPSVGLGLGIFKAAQLVGMGDSSPPLTSFTAVDLETTEQDASLAEIVEIAGVRVRDGQIVDTFASYVKPHRPITPKAEAKHGISAATVSGAPSFDRIWPDFRAFCGDDVVVAHNGHGFDFPILRRMVAALGHEFDLCIYDSLPLARELSPTSRKLVDLARSFGVPSGTSHRAFDDTKTVAHVLLALEQMKASRARKTALVDLLGHLGVALALTNEAQMCEEALRFREFARPYTLGRYSTCLDFYDRELAESRDDTLPTTDEIIDRLGGTALMLRIRAEKTADERYPEAMTRLRRLIADLPTGSLDRQIKVFLDRARLSKWGDEPDRRRVNLLTLHSTKGLEFSRVYIVGADDEQLLPIRRKMPPTLEEIEEARRVLYVGMTRTIDRLVLTYAAERGGKPSGGHQFLDEMGLTPGAPL